MALIGHARKGVGCWTGKGKYLGCAIFDGYHRRVSKGRQLDLEVIVDSGEVARGPRDTITPRELGEDLS